MSETRWGTSAKASKARLDAIPAALARREDFMARLKDAAGDRWRLADMMAEAIAMGREARGLEGVGRFGTQVVCIEEIAAAHCMDAARDAYLLASGSNAEPT